MSAAESAERHRPAYVQRQVRELLEQVVGLRGEGGFEGEGVGEVGGGLDVDLPVDGHVPEPDSDLAVLGGLGPLGLGFLGVEQVAGVVHGPVDLRVRAGVGDGCDVLVHEPGSVSGAGCRAGRDLAGLPHRHLAGDDPLPEAREAVAGLDGVAEVPLPALVDMPNASASSATQNSATSGAPGPAIASSSSVPSTIAAWMIDSTGCITAHSTATWKIRISAA